MILSAASKLYGAVTTWRRQWYAGNSGRVRRLSRPVLSVGNLRAGGSGKTPAVAHLARLLLSRGERPSILTRGYARPATTAGVTVVSDPFRVLASFDTAGDEPLMLARALPGVPVLVGRDRHASGRVAEERFGTTVHLLDDGFQHLALARDVDLLMVSEDDLTDQVLPAGSLREPLTAASAADALLVTAGYESAVFRVGRVLGVSTTFLVSRGIEAPRMVLSRESVVVPPGEPVFGVAGIARPERFFSDVASAGWSVVGTLAFPDHHRYTDRDIARIKQQAISARATIVLTTEKDAVRLEACDLTDLPIAAVPLSVTVDPADAFVTWLCSRLSLVASDSRAPDARRLHPASGALHKER